MPLSNLGKNIQVISEPAPKKKESTKKGEGTITKLKKKISTLEASISKLNTNLRIKDELIMRFSEDNRLKEIWRMNYLKSYKKAYERVKDDPLSKTKMDYEASMEAGK